MISAVRLPIDWPLLGFPQSWRAGVIGLERGPRAWAWSGGAPALGLRVFDPAPEHDVVTGWGIDHVVVLVPDLDEALTVVADEGHEVRRRLEVRGRETAFFVVGTVLEVIGDPRVDRALLFGVALWTGEPLVALHEQWVAAGFDVAEPRAAFQSGRRILNVRNAGAGLAVMTPRR